MPGYSYSGQRYHKGYEEKHSHTAAHHVVVKPPAVHSTAVSHTPTQQQGWETIRTILESIARHL